MNNTYIDFGIMLGLWVAMNQIFDALTFKKGYLEFSSMWAGIVALLVFGLCVAAYRKVKSNG